MRTFRPVVLPAAAHTAARGLGVRPGRLIAACALWMATVGNWPLWLKLAALPELANWRGIGFGVAFAALIGAGIALVLAPLAWRWTLKPALTALLLMTASGAYFMHTYGIVIDRTMLVNVLLTDTREARELLNWRLGAVLLGVGVLPAVAVWRTPVAWARPLRQLGRNLLLMALALALATAALLTVFQDFAAVMRNHTQLRFLINPLNSVYALGEMAFVPIQRSGGAVRPLGQDARLPERPATAKPPLVIMVLGETARADHLSLNGYERPTTPRLAALDVVSLRNVWSCGTNTAASVPCMFSPLARKAFEDRADNTEGLVDVLQRAGLAVLWLDNQPGGCKGVCDRVPMVDHSQLHQPALCADGECFDEVMLLGLAQRIAQLPAERRARGVVVFMHQMGSHGPAYYRRTPAPFKQFMPECATNALQQCARAEVVNAYDNTLLYTDHFLAGAIDWLKGQAGDAATALLYVSDHGESLGEGNVYLHGLPYRIAPDAQKRVPWITWLSPEFAQQSGISPDCLRARRDERFSHDHYFHSTLGLLGVQTALYDGALDMHAPCRVPR